MWNSQGVTRGQQSRGVPLGMDGMCVTCSGGVGEMQEGCKGRGGAFMECTGVYGWNPCGASVWNAEGVVWNAKGKSME